MGEASGSRYMIIKDLTDKKLDLIERKQKLNSKVSELVLELTDEQQQYVAWEKTRELENKATEERFKNTISRLTQRIEDFKKDIKNREESIDSQINEINNALNHIKEISKDSVGNKE